MCQVSGFQIREAIRRVSSKVEISRKRLNRSQTYFPVDSDGEAVAPPPIEKYISELYELESLLARLQDAQAKFNTTMRIQLEGGEDISLTEAVKLVGVLSRVIKAWSDFVGADDLVSRYVFQENSSCRDKDNIYAVPSLAAAVAVPMVDKYSAKLSRLRAAIASANAKTIEVFNIDREVLFP
jgi:hypothetical protein